MNEFKISSENPLTYKRSTIRIDGKNMDNYVEMSHQNSILH